MLIITKQHICSDPHRLNSVVAFLCQQKNGNKHEDDIEMEISSVLKAHMNYTSMLNAGMY